MSTKSKKINFIAKNQSFYNDVIEKFGGSDDYKCVYFPEIYQGICTFIMRLVSEKYFDTVDILDFTIGEIGHVHHQLEEGRMDDIEKFNTILLVIDKIIIHLRKPRSYTNRILGVELIFPYHFEAFVKWFENDYVEESILASNESYDFLTDILSITNKEIAFLLRDPHHHDLKKKFLECIAPLLK